MNKQAQLQKEASFVDGFVDSLTENGIEPEQFVKAASNTDDPSLRKMAAAMVDLANIREQQRTDQVRTKQANPMLAGLGGAAAGLGARTAGGAAANPEDPSQGAKAGLAGVLAGPLMAPEGEGLQGAAGAMGGGLAGGLGMLGTTALANKLGLNPGRIGDAIGDTIGSSPAAKGAIRGVAKGLPGATAAGYGSAKGFDAATSNPEPEQGTMEQLKGALGV